MKTKTFTLFWLTGQSEIVKGDNIADAMTLTGYGHGALGALDFYGHGDCRNEYKWDSESNTWNKLKS